MEATACSTGAVVPVQRRPEPAAVARRLLTRLPGVPALVVLAVLLRLPALPVPARPDEAGYLLVAGAVRRGGAYLYGDLWVDRPPLLVAFFRLADALGGVLTVRVLALLGVVVVVLGAADAGRTLAGPRGGRWAAATAGALLASPLLGALAVDGKLLAVPLVMTGCALGLRALARPLAGSAPARLALAGAVAGTAVLVKQNLAGGVVLLAGCVLALALDRAVPRARALRLLLALLFGAAVPVAAAVLWSLAWGAGPAALWDAVVGFRSASLEVVAAGRTQAPARRAVLLALAVVASGLAPLVALALGQVRGPRSPAAVGLACASAFAALSITLGGSYWAHYALELVPPAAVAAALVSTRAGRAPRLGLGLVLGSSVLAVAVGTPVALAGGCGAPQGAAVALAAHLRAHALPGDTGLALYGGSNALLDTGVRPAYPYLWSLPVRTLDPQLDLLATRLSGPDAATWVVRRLPLTAYGLDADGRVRGLLATGYRPVATLCGDQVLLRRGLDR